ncbi:MAG TPA: hypothetical protein VGO65_01210 [Pseudolysinimonas sp.]|nr:hypothetical protein [Pseudolysinimonas sp.]
MEPVIATVAFGQQRGDLAGDRADARLQRGAGRHVVDGVPRDRLVDVGGRRFPAGQRERSFGRAHQDVDLVDVQGVPMLVAEPERPGVGLGHLGDK